MNTRILSIAAVAALSLQAQAISHSGWSASAAYGILMPVDAKSTGWVIKDNAAGTGTGATPNAAIGTATDEFKMKNANYFDVSLSHCKSGFGVMYSATAKDVKFETLTKTATANNKLDKFIWKYNGVFATYKHPLGQMLDLTLALGSVKQTFDNTGATKEVSKRDLGGRVGVGAFYNVSKEAAIKLGLSYNYFKEFNEKYDNASTGDATAEILKEATPKFNASGLAASVALVYTM
jgi:hypothetical protein